MLCTNHKKKLGWLNRGEWGGRDMFPPWQRKVGFVQLLVETPEVEQPPGRRNPRWGRTWDRKAWTEFIRHKNRTRFLVITIMNLWLCYVLENYWMARALLDYQPGFCSSETPILVGYHPGKNTFKKFYFSVNFVLAHLIFSDFCFNPQTKNFVL